MPEKAEHNLVRSYSDGELDPEQAADLRRRISAEPELAARVRFEETLRERVRVVLEGEAAPEELRVRLRTILAQAGDQVPEPVTSNGRETAAGGWRRIFIGPERENVLAVAASIVVVAGAILIGILVPPVDSVRAPGAGELIAGVSRFVAEEHHRCAGDFRNCDGRVAWVSPREAELRLTEHLRSAVPVLDLSPLGYQFVGAGIGGVPGHPASGQIIYQREGQADDGCRKSLVSIFVVPDAGQFAGTGASAGAWVWDEIAPTSCDKRVFCATDGSLAFLVVCCNESDLKSLTEHLGRSAR